MLSRNEIRRQIQASLNAPSDSRCETTPFGQGDATPFELDEGLTLFTQAARKISDLPPRPPTLRGTVGFWLLSVVRRLSLWHLSNVTAALDSLGNLLQTSQRRHDTTSDSLQALTTSLDGLSAQLSNLSSELNGCVETLRTLDARVRAIEAATDSARHDVARILRETRSPQTAESLAAFSQLLETGSDALYLRFQDAFRGTRSSILEQMREYLPMVPPGAVSGCLDLGSGRGEWLEVLQRSGISAVGCDNNRLMVEECRSRGLTVHHSDCLDYLRSIPEGELSMISAIHVVEHLSMAELTELLDRCARVLRKGGRLLLETPNPENLWVSAYTFYFDPTHRNPIPSETLSFLVEASGLRSLQVLRLHPLPASSLFPNPQDDPMVQRINQLLFGPQDYALIAEKV